MRKMRFLMYAVMISFICAGCAKEINPVKEVIVTQITFIQTEPIYIEDFNIEDLFVTVTYSDQSTKEVYLRISWFLPIELSMLEEVGTHKLSFTYEFYMQTIDITMSRKDGVTIKSVEFIQEEPFYLENYKLETYFVTLLYTDLTYKRIFLDAHMFSSNDLNKLKEVGKHTLTIKIGDFEAPIIIDMESVNDKVVINVEFKETIICDLDQFELESYQFKVSYEDETYEYIHMSESMFDYQNLFLTNYVGIHDLRLNYKNYQIKIKVVLKTPESEVEDERSLSDITIPNDVIRDLDLIYKKVEGTHHFIGFVTYVSDTDIFVHDELTGIYVKLNKPYDLRYGDEVLVTGSIAFNGWFLNNLHIEASDIVLLSTRYPISFIKEQLFIENYKTGIQKLTNSQQVYRLFAIYTKFNDQYIFTNGVNTFSNIEMDEQTRLELEGYIDKAIEITVYYRYGIGVDPYLITTHTLSNIKLADYIYKDFDLYYFDYEKMYLENQVQDMAYKGEYLNLPNQGYFGSTLTWVFDHPDLINSQARVNPNLRQSVYESLRYQLVNDKYDQGGFVHIWLLAGDKLTIAQANTKYKDDIGEVVISGIVYHIYKGMALIYDGSGYAALKYDGKVGDMIEIYGQYQYLEGFIGSFDLTTAMIKPYEGTYILPSMSQIENIDQIANNSTYIGKIFEIEGTLESIDSYEYFNALELLGNEGRYILASQYKVLNSSRKIVFITDENIDLESLLNKETKLTFIALKVNDKNDIEAILIDMSLLD